MSIVIRMARPDDVPAITVIYAPYVSGTVISFEMVPPTEAEMATRLEKTLAQLPWLVAEVNSNVVGYAYAGKHRERAAYQWSTDVSVYMHKDWHRRGVGRVLYTALFAILRAQGYYGVYAGITLPNPGSVGLHEAMGMTPVGIYHRVGYKAGAWHDVGWWQGVLKDHTSDPRQPRALQDIASIATWDCWLATGELLQQQPQTQP